MTIHLGLFHLSQAHPRWFSPVVSLHRDSPSFNWPGKSCPPGLTDLLIPMTPFTKCTFGTESLSCLRSFVHRQELVSPSQYAWGLSMTSFNPCNKCCKVSGFKVCIQKTIALLYTSNKLKNKLKSCHLENVHAWEQLTLYMISTLKTINTVMIN